MENRNLYFARTTLRHLQHAVARAIGAGSLPPDVRSRTLELWALLHGLASLELVGELGSGPDATARWEDAVTAAITGYRSAASARTTLR